MPGLRKKLTVLVRSSLRGERSDRRPSPRKASAEVVALREQIAQALDREDRLQQTIQASEAEITALDRQADEAMARGDEATARHLIAQLQRRRQQLTLLQADLAQHRHTAADLLHRVNVLEGLLAAAQQPTAGAEADDMPLAQRIRQVRQEVNQRVESLRAPTTPPAEVALDEQAIEDDLARRRARLSQ